jgi:hypothetical protein
MTYLPVSGLGKKMLMRTDWLIKWYHPTRLACTGSLVVRSITFQQRPDLEAEDYWLRRNTMSHQNLHQLSVNEDNLYGEI